VCGFLADRPAEVRFSDRFASAAVPLGPRGRIDARATIAILERWRPDRLILQTPDLRLLRWALGRGVDALPLLADSFNARSVRGRINVFRLGRALSDPRIRAVGNHNLPAALSLRAIGVPTEKIYAWDWPHALLPENHPPKVLGGDPARLVFVGAISQAKGALDVIGAAGILARQGLAFDLTLVGDGPDLERARARVAAEGLGARVRLPGRMSHAEVVALLLTATLAITASRRSYPEGLPMTIYEGLATRTPLILSDHPMFRHYFADDPAARMAPEADPGALARAIASLLGDAGAYAAASQATLALWRRIKCDLAWGDFINAFLGIDGASLDAIAEARLDRRLGAAKDASAKSAFRKVRSGFRIRTRDRSKI
jgi:glycosyltransferase involved in cell wall biosynthesis